MSVSPLDMQILYSNLKNVGQQQAAERASELAQQHKQADESAKKSDEKDHRVGEAKDVDTGIDKVNDKDKKQEEQKGAKDKGQKDEAQNDKPDAEFFDDPDIGHNIDISG